MKKINTIKGFENISDVYYVSKDGKVFTTYFKNKDYTELKTKLSRPSKKSKNGYKTVCLVTTERKPNGKLRMIHPKVSRLVASAFIPNPENKPQVDHINEIKTDDRVENLRWVTAKENSRHSNAKKLYMYSKEKLEKIYNCGADVKEDGYNSGHAFAVARGEEKHHKGMYFSFKEVSQELVVQRLSKPTFKL